MTKKYNWFNCQLSGKLIRINSTKCKDIWYFRSLVVFTCAHFFLRSRNGRFYCLKQLNVNRVTKVHFVANHRFPILTKRSTLNTLEEYLKINKIA